jgi:hypothetical protein
VHLIEYIETVGETVSISIRGFEKTSAETKREDKRLMGVADG